tara:strand:+ start:6006 stop:7118 length:1113 start_codon:yes stop_codon:yes gene_type:complete
MLRVPNFIYPVFILSFLGVCIQLYLSNSGSDSIKTVSLMIVAYLAGYFFSRQKVNNAWNISIISTVICFLLLILVLFLPEIRGINSWIRIGPFTLQPSELAKVGLIVVNSVILGGRKGVGLGPMNGFVFCLLVNALVFILIALQPEMGTLIVMAGITWIQVFCSKVNKFLSTGLPIIAILIFFIGGKSLIPFYESVPFVKPHQVKRIETFFAGSEAPLDDRRQLKYTHIQMAEGGLWGSGFSESVKQELAWIPERQNDFVIGVFFRTGGLFLVSLIIGLYSWASFGALNFSERIPPGAAKQLLVGFAGYVIFHCCFNVGVALGLIPTTGFPLIPLSQGGSGWISLGCLVGLVLSVLSSHLNLYNSRVVGG